MKQDLIPDRWYAILESEEVRQGRPLGATRMGKKLAFWRDQKGAVQCVADTCVHRGASLSTGKVLGGNIQCPFHGLRVRRLGGMQAHTGKRQGIANPRPLFCPLIPR